MYYTCCTQRSLHAIIFEVVMIDTKKLLYILPDVAYTAELLPSKKPHSFTIHAFTQINGSFFDENENFIAEKVDKLFSKLEENESYHLVLPDFLFTNTIIAIKETTESKIKEHLKNETLPSMDVSAQTHEIATVILNQLRGTTRVQLAALEKEALASVRVAASTHGVQIIGISPLSWVIKSAVSLEPSITVTQLGGQLYAAEHYIGVDQTSHAPVDDCESIAETIKTLKGTEPSIQTIYLFSNALVEEKLKELLNKTIPLQQMASQQDEDERMPSYVRQTIESSMRTLSIEEYPVPVFQLGKATASDKESLTALLSTPATETDEDDTVSDLPKPSPRVVAAAVSTPEELEEAEDEVEVEEIEEVEEEVDEPEEKETEKRTEDEETTLLGAERALVPDVEEKELEIEETEEDEAPVQEEDDATLESIVELETKTPPKKPRDADAETAVSIGEAPESHIDLRQFVQAQSESSTPVAVKSSTPPIQHSSGVWPMMKMILIAVGVFLVTVGVGVGIGFAFLKFSVPETTTPAPVVEVVTTPTPQPLPTATPEVASGSATVATKPGSLKIFIVNATKKAGYAGTIKTKVDTLKLGTVTTGNAAGTYTEGTYIASKTTDAALTSKLEKATGLTFTDNPKVATDENPKGTYDIVIVLAE